MLACMRTVAGIHRTPLSRACGVPVSAASVLEAPVDLQKLPYDNALMLFNPRSTVINMTLA